MMKKHRRYRCLHGLLGVGAGLWLALVVPAVHAAEPVEPDHAQKMAKALALFRSEVRGVLMDQCLKCHGGEKVKAGFSLATREELLKGGDSGAVVVPGDAEQSLLVKVIRHDEEPHMPSKQPRLSDAQIAKIAEWIELGAAYDKPLAGKEARKPSGDVSEEDRRFWSFLPLAKTRPPTVRAATVRERSKDKAEEPLADARGSSGWARTPVDAFILATLAEKGLTPNPIADRRTLIRRAYFDLIGLPPAPSEVEAFVNDQDPTAYEKLVDRLLLDPRFGERWARHWLDVARYAESSGFEQDYDRPGAYWYRDFVIRAFNEDMPYDRFVKWQLAGDEYEPGNTMALAATGFLVAGVFPTQLTENEFESSRYDQLDDMLATTGTAFLGLTIGCARCHDHKFDPIPNKDYFRMLSTFTTAIRSEVDVDLGTEEQRKSQADWEAEHQRLLAAVKAHETAVLAAGFEEWLKQPQAAAAAGAEQAPKEVADALAIVARGEKAKLTEPQRAALLGWYGRGDAKYGELRRALAEHEKVKPPSTVVKVQVCSEGVKKLPHHADDRGFPHFYPKTFFLNRGDVTQKQGEATQGFLQVLTRGGKTEADWRVPPPEGSPLSYRRRSMAEWITDTEYGAGHLLARVIVNRLWQHHMGRGIVATPSDFGFQGEPPTHPELLDWLAGELIQSGWSLKHIHRLIATSAVYTQGSGYDEARAAVDRDNKLYWRRTPRRLEAEAIRDATLAVSGQLDGTMYGPGTLDLAMNRRSVYFFIKRSQLIPTMLLFDAPDSLVGIADRPETTVAPQALLMMNNPIVRGYAQGFARRVRPTAETPVPEAVRRAYQAAFGRDPSEAELADAAAFVTASTQSYTQHGPAEAEHLALADLCQVLMGLNEFVYVD